MTSTIKVDNIQDQDGNNIINENSNTITIGASGDTVALASGASQSGFGRSGTVDWQTSIKTSNFTAASGEGYFCDTNSSGAFTVTLPASPSAGDIVAVADYANTFDTANLTLGRNSSNIEGAASDLALNVEGCSITVVYADATKGWIVVNSGNSEDGRLIPKFVAATGGCITTSGDFKIHKFTGNGTFCVTCAGNPGGSDTVEYLVVAGGGGGGSHIGGGGGGGGARYVFPSPATGGLPVLAQGYPITIGGGGAGATDSGGTSGASGSNTVFSSITSAGGGEGGSAGAPQPCGSKPNGSGHAGGAGGGSGHGNGPGPLGPVTGCGGAGNTPPVSPPQGKDGGKGFGYNAHGGGGGGGGGCAGVQGADGSNPAASGGNGGNGSQVNICGNNYYWGGGGGGTAGIGPSQPAGTGGNGGLGGGGGASVQTPGTAGTGGGSAIASGGNGGTGSPAGPTSGAGGANSGGGGGGGSHNNGDGGAGGSGIVIIRYKFQ